MMYAVSYLAKDGSIRYKDLFATQAEADGEVAREVARVGKDGVERVRLVVEEINGVLSDVKT